VGSFDKEVEDQRDEADEGEDCNTYCFLIVRGIKFALCNIPRDALIISQIQIEWSRCSGLQGHV
jgi:hypothetical protein